MSLLALRDMPTPTPVHPPLAESAKVARARSRAWAARPAATWTLLGLFCLLPVAAALDPSGSTEPASETYVRPSTPAPSGLSAASRASAPAASAPLTRPVNPSVQAVSAQEAPSASAAAVDKRADIADTAQLSPDGSSSLDPSAASTTALAESAAPPAVRKEPLRLTPGRPNLATPSQQARWHLLSEVQRNLLAPFEEQWAELSTREKQALANMAQRFPEVSAGDQERSMKRLAEWAELTPEDRRLARYNYRWMQQLDRSEVLAAWEQYQSLTPEQRAVLAAVGRTSNTAATHPGRRTGLAAEAAQPLPRRPVPVPELPGL